MPFSSLVRAIFEPGSRHFRVSFVSFSSIVHARLRWNRLTSFAEGSEEGARGDGKKEVSFEATCKLMPISSPSGSEIHVGANWL